jgi:FkbM family methyltransferase
VLQNNSMKRFLRRWVRNLELESSPLILRARRFYPRRGEAEQLERMLAENKITAVLDVGANVGQFARGLRLRGYRGRIISFEPLARAHARLRQAAKNDPRWIVPEAVAIGDRNGPTVLHIAGDSVSSSVLEMLDAHRRAAPDSAYVASETVRLAKLDTAAVEFLEPQDVVFLKIDVQGFESQVLAGAKDLLPRVKGLMLELSLVPCYRNQVIFQPMLEFLGHQGFELWNLMPGTAERETERLLQVDGVFFRSDSSPTPRPTGAAERLASAPGGR